MPDIDEAVDGTQRSNQVVVGHPGGSLVAVSRRAGGQRWPGTTAPHRLLATATGSESYSDGTLIRLADAVRSAPPNIFVAMTQPVDVGARNSQGCAIGLGVESGVWQLMALVTGFMCEPSMAQRSSTDRSLCTDGSVLGGSLVLMATTWEARDGTAVWNGRALADWVDDLVAEIVEDLAPVGVWLLGSVARGEDDGDSDIDLLIVLESYSPDRAVALKRRLREQASVPVPFDVAFTDAGRFAERSVVAGTLERAATREGRCVYERG